MQKKKKNVQKQEQQAKTMKEDNIIRFSKLKLTVYLLIRMIKQQQQQ